MQKKARRGFTLPEVLVTVTVVAVLAAVVVPAVTQYVGKGDTPATLTDLNALRTATTSFVADTRVNPQSIYDLTLSSAPSYVTSAGGNFHGPYLAATVGGNTSTGTFYSSGLKLTLGPTISSTTSTGYLTTTLVMPANATCQDLWNLDKSFDGSDAATTDAATMAAAGNLVWTGGCNQNSATGTSTSAAATLVTAGPTVITLRLVSIGT